MIHLIICGVIGWTFIILGIYMLTGRGEFLLAGYNTMSESEKEKYDAEALCKFMGKIVLIIGVLTFLLGIESIVTWYGWIYTVAVVGLSIFSGVYANKSARFRK